MGARTLPKSGRCQGCASEATAEPGVYRGSVRFRCTNAFCGLVSVSFTRQQLQALSRPRRVRAPSTGVRRRAPGADLGTWGKDGHWRDRDERGG